MYSLLIYIFFIICCIDFTLLSQNNELPPAGYEIEIKNKSATRTIRVKIYPVSMIFNNFGFYDLHTRFPDNQYPNKWHYLNATCENGDTVGYFWNIAPNSSLTYQHENAVQAGSIP